MRVLQSAPGLRAAAAAAVLGLAVDVVYLGALSTQGDPSGSREGLVVASLAVAAGASLGASLIAAPLRACLLAWSAATFASWAFLGAASIGLLLVPSSALTLVALRRSLDEMSGRLAVAGGATCALLVVSVGLSLTT